MPKKPPIRQPERGAVQPAREFTEEHLESFVSYDTDAWADNTEATRCSGIRARAEIEGATRYPVGDGTLNPGAHRWMPLAATFYTTC
jgi:hypothetical protein